MSFVQTLIGGNKGSFKPESLTPMQKLTLRYVVVGLVYYAFAAIEGMIMRIYQVKPISFHSSEAVLRDFDRTSSGWNLRIDIHAGLRRISLPCANVAEEATLEFQVGKLDMGFDYGRYVYFLVRWIYFSLRPALHALLAATCRF